jgi:hypothetical protein
MLQFPYALVLTQDCDLEQNRSCRAATPPPRTPSELIANDKHLVSVMVAPLYNFEHLAGGDHLSELKIETQKFNSKQKSDLKTNQLARYHYFEFDSSAALPSSVVDFKHYFSVSLAWLESNLGNCVCGVGPLYRESVSQRFSNYLSRIALPEPAQQSSAAEGAITEKFLRPIGF